MKKLFFNIIMIMLLFFSACANTENQLNSYALQRVDVDGKIIAAPEGKLSISNDGHYFLTLDENTCEIEVDNGKVKLNGLNGSLVYSDEVYVLSFENTGLTYFFTNSQIADDTDTQETISSRQEVIGRVFFTNTTDLFCDYEGRSIPITGFVCDDGFVLYSNDYSEDMPIADLDSAGDGLFMNYAVKVDIKEFTASDKYLSDYYNYAEPFKYRPWDAPSGYFDEEPTGDLKYTRIKGNCDNKLDFEIIITLRQA